MSNQVEAATSWTLLVDQGAAKLYGQYIDANTIQLRVTLTPPAGTSWYYGQDWSTENYLYSNNGNVVFSPHAFPSGSTDMYEGFATITKNTILSPSSGWNGVVALGLHAVGGGGTGAVLSLSTSIRPADFINNSPVLNMTTTNQPLLEEKIEFRYHHFQ